MSVVQELKDSAGEWTLTVSDMVIEFESNGRLCVDIAHDDWPAVKKFIDAQLPNTDEA